MAIGRAKEDEFGALARNGGALIDQLILDICASNYCELKNRSIKYVSGAVWGMLKDGAIDQVQRRINTCVDPVVTKWLEMIGSGRLNPNQEFAVQYAIRGWILSRILYTLLAADKFEAENTVESTNPVEIHRLN